MKKNILKKVSIGIGLGLTILPFLALAQAPLEPLITSPTQIAQLIQKILNWVAGIIMTIAVIMLLFSAILYLTAGGSEERVGKAKSYLLYAIIGIVVAILAFSIQPFLVTFFRGNF
ncbi:MAG: pilin [Candidatus Azambacteria bacterium]|nr:pilin [Candidatus Azambacteria bacterium]